MKGAAPKVHDALWAREAMATGTVIASLSHMIVMDPIEVIIGFTAMTIIAQV